MCPSLPEALMEYCCCPIMIIAWLLRLLVLFAGLWLMRQGRPGRSLSADATQQQITPPANHANIRPAIDTF